MIATDTDLAREPHSAARMDSFHLQVQPGRRLTGEAAMPVTRAKKPSYYQQVHSAQRNLSICKGFHCTAKAVIGYYLSRTNH